MADSSTSDSLTPSFSDAAKQNQTAIGKLYQNLRPGQDPLGDWQGGEMAVSAVPGAGKSYSLSIAAAITITRHQLNSLRQLVIVTYTRSAVASLKSKIREQLRSHQLPTTGFNVQTLHSLALQIASRHPEQSGLNLQTVNLITPTPNHRIIRDCVEQWRKVYPELYRQLLAGADIDREETEILRRHACLRTEVLPKLAHTAIREAKSSGLAPSDLWQLSEQTRDDYQILAIAAGLYEQYEQLMRSRALIDYDDMILGALRVLNQPAIVDHWQKQVFAVFEDEAQDSSPLQGQLISILSGGEQHKNLIRVGDPNQAINSTFTPADPVYFNWFCDRAQSQNRLFTMDEAGRSAQIIIEAANFALQWMQQYWIKQNNQPNPGSSDPLPVETNQPHVKTETPFRTQNIRCVSQLEDPQPNPMPEGQGLEIYCPEDVYETVDLIAKRVITLLKAYPERNAAILVRENRQGRFLAQQLKDLQKKSGIRLYEVSEYDRFSEIPAEILQVLRFLDRPHSPDHLRATLEIFKNRQLIAVSDLNALISLPEQFLYPSPLDPKQSPSLLQARRFCCQLLQARIELPHYQLIPFLAMALQYSGSELATVHKLAERIEQQPFTNGSLKTAIAALEEIVASERFEAIDEESEDQYVRPNQLTIITMHKAKGLDWDYVFVPFLQRDVLPGRLWVPAAAKFLGEFTLAEVARAQIRTAVHTQFQIGHHAMNLPEPFAAWQEAQSLKTAEEFRLLYVAMTRAKRLLWMSSAYKAPFFWGNFQNSNRDNLTEKPACPTLPALMAQFPQSVMNRKANGNA